MISTRDLRKQVVQPKWSERQSCRICEKHMFATSLHHITPLSVWKELFNDAEEQGVDEFSVVPRVVWLCDNCHHYIHMLMSENTIQQGIAERNLTKEELKKAEKIIAMSEKEVNEFLDLTKKRGQ